MFAVCWRNAVWPESRGDQAQLEAASEASLDRRHDVPDGFATLVQFSLLIPDPEAHCPGESGSIGPVVWRPQHRSSDCGQLRFCGGVLQKFRIPEIRHAHPELAPLDAFKNRFDDLLCCGLRQAGLVDHMIDNI